MQEINFFDDVYIERTYNLSRSIHRPAPASCVAVLQPSEPWEKLLCCYGSVLFDDSVYKAYYTLWWLDSEPPYSCQAEAIAFASSVDGLHWEKPSLNIVQEVNQGHNNLIHHGMFADQPCVMRLHEPHGDHRYAMIYYGDFAPQGPGVRLCYSSDGIHWNWPGEVVWQTALDRFADDLDFFAADDTLTCHFDPRSGKYVILRKVMQEHGLSGIVERTDWNADPHTLRRSIVRAESSDLHTWENFQVVLAPDRDDPPGVDFHRLSVRPFGDYYLGLLEIHDGRPGNQTVDLDLVFSRDGISWLRPDRKQHYISRGPVGSWNEGVVFAPAEGLCVGPENFVFYGGLQARLNEQSLARCRHGGIGTCRIDPTRLCSLNAPAHQEGLLISRPLRIGKELRLNARVQDGGELCVALFDAEENPLVGYEWDAFDTVSNDAVNVRLTWGQRFTPVEGVCRIGVRLRDADLFSITMY